MTDDSSEEYVHVHHRWNVRKEKQNNYLAQRNDTLSSPGKQLSVVNKRMSALSSPMLHLIILSFDLLLKFLWFGFYVTQSKTSLTICQRSISHYTHQSEKLFLLCWKRQLCMPLLRRTKLSQIPTSRSKPRPQSKRTLTSQNTLPTG